MKSPVLRSETQNPAHSVHSESGRISSVSDPSQGSSGPEDQGDGGKSEEGPILSDTGIGPEFGDIFIRLGDRSDPDWVRPDGLRDGWSWVGL